MEDSGQKSDPPASRVPGESSRPFLRRAIEKLRSVHNGEQGLLEAIACGAQAIPALRALLFAREPSGLFQTRCLAVQGLASLEASDVLIDFLSARPEIADATERVGEDAVINAAARALMGRRDELLFDLLMTIAETRLLPGVIAALGAFGRVEPLPYFIAALAEDESRPAAGSALRDLGPSACEALAAVAASRQSSRAEESQSRIRQRRSALILLSEIGMQPHLWPVLRQAMWDQDARISALACQICLSVADECEKPDAVRRLVGLLENADYLLSLKIEQCLATHFDLVKEFFSAIDKKRGGDPLAENAALRTFLRVKAHAEALEEPGNRRSRS